MQERDGNMESIPTVKMKQPRVEQAHRYLADALSEVGKAQEHAEMLDDKPLKSALDEVEYLLHSLRETLPPRQLELPF